MPFILFLHISPAVCNCVCVSAAEHYTHTRTLNLWARVGRKKNIKKQKKVSREHGMKRKWK